MTTLIDTVQPPEEHVVSALPDALAGRTEDEFVESYISALILRIKSSPKIYRSYGAWWPSVKELIIASGELGFGVTVDIDVAAIYKMSRPALTVIAGHLYSHERIDNGLIYSAYHVMDVHDSTLDSEPYVWVSGDDYMEILCDGGV